MQHGRNCILLGLELGLKELKKELLWIGDPCLPRSADPEGSTPNRSVDLPSKRIN
jgi:hypothetical protein